jgi:nucleoside-diphosphate-sugar epimerase
MKVLVTGGAGYKGVKLTAKLLGLGHDVTILDNFLYGFEPVLHLVENPNLDVVKADIRNPIEGIHRFDVVYHLAGVSGLPACAANPSSAYLINVDATRQLAESLGEQQLLIYASTTSFYGKAGNQCTEETPVDPVSFYGKTKYEAEQIVMERENSISLRFATVFGFSPKMRMDLMVNDFTYKALKEGVVVLFDSYAKRTFIHIDDAVDCYCFAMEQAGLMRSNIYNAGDDHLNYSKLEIAETIKAKHDFSIVDSDVKDKDVRHFLIDYSKVQEVGFRPRKTIEDGVTELLRIFRFYDHFVHYRVI